jgi:hypothetical protein
LSFPRSPSASALDRRAGIGTAQARGCWLPDRDRGGAQGPTQDDLITQPVRKGPAARSDGRGVSLERRQQLDTTLGGVDLTERHDGPFLLDPTSRHRQISQQQLQRRC